jgi:hypothetical protein
MTPPNQSLDRMTRSAVASWAGFGRPCRAPRHRSAFRWALMHALWAVPVVVLVGCAQPGLDELPHSRPTKTDRQVAEENWQQLENAFTAQNPEAARILVGKPILFHADFDRSRAAASGRRARLFSDEEEKRMSSLPQSEKHHMITRHFEAWSRVPCVPCRWELTRRQKQAARSCCSVGVEVYGILRSFNESGIEVDPRDFGLMLCL